MACGGCYLAGGVLCIGMIGDMRLRRSRALLAAEYEDAALKERLTA